MIAIWRLSFCTLLLVAMWLALVPADQLPSTFYFWDKAEHALGFSVLTLLGMVSFPGRIRWLVCGLLLFGAGIEYAQYLTGWRQGDWADWVADCAGLVMGFVFWKVTILLIKIRR